MKVMMNYDPTDGLTLQLDSLVDDVTTTDVQNMLDELGETAYGYGFKLSGFRAGSMTVNLQALQDLQVEVERLRPVWHAARYVADCPLYFSELDSRLSNLRAAVASATVDRKLKNAPEATDEHPLDPRGDVARELR